VSVREDDGTVGLLFQQVRDDAVEVGAAGGDADDRAEGGVERRAVRRRDRRCGIETMLGVIAREPLLPARLGLGRKVNRRMAEEVHVHRRLHALANDVDLLARLLRRQHRTRQRAESTALRHGDHQFRIHHAGHRRQHDRKFGLEEVDQSTVRPHGCSL